MFQNLSGGIDTVVGEKSASLSHGQRQLVCFARAMLADPRILVLDEATSHLDLRNERSVNEAVRSLRMTRVVVAHRPETIAMADRVVAMAGGRIAGDEAAASPAIRP